MARTSGGSGGGGGEVNVAGAGVTSTGATVGVFPQDPNDLTVSGTAISTAALKPFAGTRPIVIEGAANTSVAISSAAATGTGPYTITLTLPSTTNFCQGQPITVAGMTGTNPPNGTFTIASVPAPSTNAATPGTTVTYVWSGAAPSGLSGGTATTPSPLSTTVACAVAGSGTLAAAATNAIAPSSAITITGVLLSINNVVLTVASTAGLYIDKPITVAGITGFGSGGGNAIPNGQFRIAALTATTVTYTYANGPQNAPGTYGGGGTIVQGTSAVWGIDDTTAWRALTAIAAANGTSLYHPGGISICNTMDTPKQVSPGFNIRGAGREASVLMATSGNFTGGYVLSRKGPCDLADLWVHGGYIGGGTGAGCALLDSGNAYPVQQQGLTRVNVSHISQQNNGSQQNYLWFAWSVQSNNELRNVSLEDVTFGPYSNPYQDAIGLTGCDNCNGVNVTFLNCARSPDFFTFNYLNLTNVIVRDPLSRGAGPNVQFLFQTGQSNANQCTVQGLEISDFYQTGQYYYCGANELMLDNAHLPGQEIQVAGVTGGATTTITLAQAPNFTIAAGQTLNLQGIFNGAGSGWQTLNQYTTIAVVTSQTVFTVNISTSGATGTPVFNCATATFDAGTCYLDLNATGKTYQSIAYISNSYLGSGIRIENNGGGWGLGLLSVQGGRIGCAATAAGALQGSIFGTASLTAAGRIVVDGTTWNTMNTFLILTAAGCTAELHFNGGCVVDTPQATQSGTTISAGSAVRGIDNWNPLGTGPGGTGAVAVPATAGFVNQKWFDRTFYITNGAAALTVQRFNAANSAAVGSAVIIPASGFGTITLPAGNSLKYTYASGTPTQLVDGN